MHLLFQAEGRVPDIDPLSEKRESVNPQMLVFFMDKIEDLLTVVVLESELEKC